MDLLKNTLYINLDHRKDRLEHVQLELAKIGVVGERFPAIQTKSGAVGCTMSHIKCIELAKQRGYEHVFICEDDITFLDPTVFLDHLQKFEDDEDINWDVVIVSGNNAPPFFPVQEYTVRVLNCQTTTGYIVKQEYYDTLLKNFKESAHQLIQDPTKVKEYAADIHWKKLQSQDFWYLIVPLTVIQYENHSDIENRTTDYKDLMLDLDKLWLGKPIQFPPGFQFPANPNQIQITQEILKYTRDYYNSGKT
jgi:GR25 family glycosyltransferase involved in LPS biosynthesis